MPNTNKEFFQAELDRLTTQVGSIDLTQAQVSPVTGKIVQTIADKNTQLTNMRNEAAYAYGQLQQINAADTLASNAVQTGQYPFISGVKTHFQTSGRSMTTEWGLPTTKTFLENLLALTVGIKFIPSSNYVTQFPDAQSEWAEVPLYDTNTNQFKFEPKNIDSGMPTTWADASYQTYPMHPFIFFTLRNNNLTTNKTIQLNYNTSASNNTYGQSLVAIFTPDNTNSLKSSISSYATSNLYTLSTSQSNQNSGAINITVPADKTLIVCLMSSDQYYGVSTSQYSYKRNIFINNPRTLFTQDTDIVPDYNIMENMRRGMQGDSIFTSLLDLWKVVPPTNRLSQVSSNVDISNILDKTLPVYNDNASAIAGGLTSGRFYRTSSGVVSVVI